MDKVIDIIVTYNDYVNKATLPVVCEFSTIIQMFFTIHPNFQNNATLCVQTGAGILLPFQSVDSNNLGFYDHFDTASS